MRNKRFVLIASAALAALAGVGTIAVIKLGASKKAAPAVVTAAPAVTGEISLTGKIRPQQVVSVAAPIEGVVGAFFAEVGQEVFEGQLLARITNGGLEAGQDAAKRELENAQSRVNALEGDAIAARLEASRARADASRQRVEYDRLDKLYKRQQMLFNEGATPKVAYEKAAGDFERAQSEFKNLEQVAADAEAHVAEIVKRLDAEKQTLNDKSRSHDDAKSQSGAAEVVSPAQGIVVARTGEVGQPVAPDRGDLFTIGTQLGQLEVVLDPDPPTLRRIQAGQRALVLLADMGGEGLPGTVKGIQGNQAVVVFANPNPAIKPGMTAQVRIR